MEYIRLGNSDLKVSRLCLGGMSFGDPASRMHEWTLDPQQSGEVVAHALDLGINFFDTANCYSAGTGEEYLGRALKKLTARDKVVLASKVYFNDGHLSRAAIEREIEGSLRRLGTDYLDLYIIHRYDATTPPEETMRALDDLVKAGKVRALGASAMYGFQFHNLQLLAKENGLTPFVSMQNHYNPLYREDERELIPICRQMKCGADALQSAGGGAGGALRLERRYGAQPYRQGGARQIRHHGGGRPPNRAENCRPGAKIRHNDDGRFFSVAFCQRGGVAGHRGNQNRLSRRCRRRLCRSSDRGGCRPYRRVLFTA